ncbi:MAG TPA: SIMPL domain-containing protein, partial [Solirubrobacteraceae bacterium]
VAKRSAALTELMDELGIARRDRSTTGVTVAEEFDHTPEGRRSLGHRATASTSARLADTEMIGRLVMRASDELAARIAGPSWRISAGNPAWLEAARQAAGNARAKAAAYAAGVDARLGPLISLSEPSDEHRLLLGTTARAAAAPELNVEAGEQEVIASITVTFALETD